MKIFIPVVTAALLASTAALAQTTAPSPTTPSPSPTAPAERAPTPPSSSTAPSSTTPSASASATMTEDQAKAWIDKAVYSSDNKNIGDVAAIKRDPSGKVTELHADVGGFLGIGTSRVRLMPSEFRMEGDRVVVTLTADQVKTLPKVDKTESTGSGASGSSTTPGSTGPSGTTKTK
ncbi:MAG: PRC-barrel domain-containing protein [Hyphomicrobiaceae bacterium]|nr:PRC-barrel domain-containing protein [Hyphomicrobiaceae bacterium]